MKKGLSGNQLKILALIAMTCDHVGKYLLPDWIWLQIFGRLAFPIYAYLIAEGCKYTKNRKRYVSLLAFTAVVCQVVYLFVMDSLYQCIMVTFTLSVLLIYIVDYANRQQGINKVLIVSLAVVGVYVLTMLLPQVIRGFYIDYGFWGVMLPAVVYRMNEKRNKLIMAGIVLVAQAMLSVSPIQGYALLAIPVLAFYNGTRGVYRLKYLFYIYYPTHLVVLYLIKMWIEMR